MHSKEGTPILPAGFADLASFAEWGDLQSAGDRYLKRQMTPYPALVAFHGAMAPRLDAIFDLLDGYPLGALPEAEARLFRMTLGLAEAAQAVETFGRSTIAHLRVPHHVEMHSFGPAGDAA